MIRSDYQMVRRTGGSWKIISHLHGLESRLLMIIREYQSIWEYMSSNRILAMQGFRKHPLVQYIPFGILISFALLWFMLGQGPSKYWNTSSDIEKIPFQRVQLWSPLTGFGKWPLFLRLLLSVRDLLKGLTDWTSLPFFLQHHSYPYQSKLKMPLDI